jgi:hypothetical protein
MYIHSEINLALHDIPRYLARINILPRGADKTRQLKASHILQRSVF